jgi:hypothetical protein
MNKKSIVGICLSLFILGSSLGYALSQSSGTFTTSQGVYPGAPSYTIWQEDSTYYAKNVYGAIDYSGTNGTTIIQNALDNGRTIFLKAGIYVASGFMNTNNVLVGEGNATEFRGTIYANSIVDFSIENMRISGSIVVTHSFGMTMDSVNINALGTTNGICISDNSNDIDILSTRVYNATEDNIKIVESNRINILNVASYYAGRDGLHLYDIGDNPPGALYYNPPIVTNSFFLNNERYGIYAYEVHDLTISDNDIERNKLTGVYIHGPIEAKIAHNQIEYDNQNNESGHGALVLDFPQSTGGDVYGAIVTGNFFQASRVGVEIKSVADTKAAIIISSNVFFASPWGLHAWYRTPEIRLSVQDNIFRQTTTAILLENTTLTASNTLLLGNILDTCVSGMRLDYVTGVNIHDNKFISCSATIELLHGSTAEQADNMGA